MIRLKEMVSPNKHPDIKLLKKKGSEVDDLLDTHEKEHLGSGVYGAAFDRPKRDSAIKVYDDDEGYHDFAKHAKANHENDPHLPKIHAVHKIKGTRFGVVRMEKLHKLTKDHPVHKYFATTISSFGASGATQSGIARIAYNGKDLHNKLHKTAEGKEMKKSHPTLHASLSKLAKRYPKGEFDLHSGNVMQRKDGTPVITDPITGTGKTMKEETAAPTNNIGSGAIAPTDGNVVGSMVRRKKFAGAEVFDVSSDTFHKSKISKKHRQHWKTYVGEDDTGRSIREYANKNPKSPIVIADERTGAMFYARYGQRK